MGQYRVTTTASDDNDHGGVLHDREHQIIRKLGSTIQAANVPGLCMDWICTTTLAICSGKEAQALLSPVAISDGDFWTSTIMMHHLLKCTQPYYQATALSIRSTNIIPPNFHRFFGSQGSLQDIRSKPPTYRRHQAMPSMCADEYCAIAPVCLSSDTSRTCEVKP